MLSSRTIIKIRKFYNNKPLVVEGANGSLGVSLAIVLKELNIKPKLLILTSLKTNIDKEWYNVGVKLYHFKNFYEKNLKKKINFLKKNKNLNIIYCAGYGRPNVFLKDQFSVINSNIINLLEYNNLENIFSFSYISSSEIYSGLKSKVKEGVKLMTAPQHPRGIYIESKRLGESIVENLIGRKCNRYASYRVALAFPPKLLKKDNRVMSDLVNNGKIKKIVTLNGGGNYIRQYQYGPNCMIKILSSMAIGKSNLYNNAGSHQTTLKKLAKIIGEVLNVPVNIKKKLKDTTAPKQVLIDSSLINLESKYNIKKENSLKFYIRKMINYNNV